ncbi:MAG: ferrous iron transport protein A [Gammaproteobacteria bacterium]|nr:ferrous iron transport protein A [Gammaproteobacteria bacterium]
MTHGSEKPFALAMAAEGQRVRIHALRAGRNLDGRLTELGLNVGTEITVIQRQGSGLVVSRGAGRLAIGGGMAMKVLVVPA